MDIINEVSKLLSDNQKRANSSLIRTKDNLEQKYEALMVALFEYNEALKAVPDDPTAWTDEELLSKMEELRQKKREMSKL